MKYFNAEQARNLAESNNAEQLEQVIPEIKAVAQNGRLELHVSYQLTAKAKSELTDMGFKIVDAPSVAHQKESHYHTISW